MLAFDETSLIEELAMMPNDARVAFAAAAATRQLAGYERFSRDCQLRPLVMELWSAIKQSAVDDAAWSSRLDEVMGLLPEESSDWSTGHALAEDALSSLVYAIRCLLKPEPQEAAWAARRAYEAADQAAIRLSGLQPGIPTSEAAILAHELVQRELSRQRIDLRLLRGGSFDDVERGSFQNHLLNEEETEALLPSVSTGDTGSSPA